MKEISTIGRDAIERALEELGINTTVAERIIKNGDKFEEEIHRTTIASLRSLSILDTYSAAEVSLSYPSNYRPKNISTQISILREYWEDLEGEVEGIKNDLPEGAEGLFAIPRWEQIASTYREASEIVLGLLKKDRKGKLHDYCNGQLSSKRLRRTKRTVEGFEMLKQKQKGSPILFVPVQFGVRHKGRSVGQARETFIANEFGLGVYEVGVMLLTHKERLLHDDDLWIDCAGDEYDTSADGSFTGSPLFIYRGGEIKFGDGWITDASPHGGTASAFVPPQVIR